MVAQLSLLFIYASHSAKRKKSFFKLSKLPNFPQCDKLLRIGAICDTTKYTGQHGNFRNLLRIVGLFDKLNYFSLHGVIFNKLGLCIRIVVILRLCLGANYNIIQGDSH